MEITHPNIIIQAGASRLRNEESALKKIVKNDPRILKESLLNLPLVFAGMVFQLGALQWFFLGLTLLAYMLACIFRTAALLKARDDMHMDPFQVHRIRVTGDALVKITGAICMVTCLFIYSPIIWNMIQAELL